MLGGEESRVPTVCLVEAGMRIASLGTACSPELGLSGLAWQEAAAESALALLREP